MTNLKQLKKLSMVALCMGFMGVAVAAEPIKDTVPSPKPLSQQTPTSGEGMPSADWQSKQWDKKQWNAMTPKQKEAYKKQHHDAWDKMTPEEKDAMRAKHKGHKNHMDDKWDHAPAMKK